MKTLYLLRHAHAAPEAPPLMGDHERILTGKGAEEARKVAAYMKTHGIFPDYVLSSSSVRTLQTVRIIMGVLFDEEGRKIETRFDRTLYLANPSMIIKDIRETSDTHDHLLVVGHNPGIAELALHLSHDEVHEFPTAALAVFETDAGTWDAFDLGKLKLKEVFTP